MRKLICSFALILSLIFCSVGFSACKTATRISENLDGYIADLAKYSSIGVAKRSSNFSNKNNLDSSNNSNVNILYAADNEKTSTCLVGVNKDSVFEEVCFEKDNENLLSGFNVLSYNQTNRYILITYSDLSVSKIHDTQFWNNEHCRTYLIDKSNNLVFLIDSFEQFQIGMYGYGIIGSDCGNFIVIYSNNTYYKVGVENKQLKLQEIFKQDTIHGGAEIQLCDKYGNCVIKRYNSNKYYILNNNGLLKTVYFELDLCQGINHPGITYRAIDGQIYHYNKVLNQEGNFVDASNVPAEYILPSEALVYSTETTDYYFLAKNFDSSRNYMWFYPNKLIKVEKGNNSYTFNEVPFNVNEEGLQAGEYFCSFENDTDIIQTSILTGEQNIVKVNENIILNSISVHNFNEISFVGINEQLQTIKGIINENGDISYEYVEPEFQTYFFQPLQTNL